MLIIWRLRITESRGIGAVLIHAVTVRLTATKNPFLFLKVYRLILRHYQEGTFVLKVARRYILEQRDIINFPRHIFKC